jgi:acyl-CoA thioesterase
MNDARGGPPDTATFDEAINVEGGGRRYDAVIHPSWDGALTTHGGVLAALLLSAVDAEINADGRFQPRSLTAHYLRPPQHGAVGVFVDPIRRGRRFASSRATLSQNGKPCVAALATHSVHELEEIESWQPPPPAARPAPDRSAPSRSPEELRKGADGWLRMPPGVPSFFDRVLLAPRFGEGPFSGAPVDPAAGTCNGGWLTTREPRRIDAAWLAFAVDALWPSVLQPLRTAAMAPTLDLTIHIRAAIPAEGLPDQPLLLHNTSRAVEGGLADSDSVIFAADGTLLAQGRQLQLVAPVDS